MVALFNKKKGQPEVLEWRGLKTIPAVFAIDQIGREIVGMPVSELIGKGPRAVVTRAKRMMGTNNQFKLDGKVFRAEEISARIVNHARIVAQEHLRNKIVEEMSIRASKVMGAAPPSDWVTDYLDRHPQEVPINQAVITVPAYFNDAQKQATRAAGELAGIQVLRLMHEPTAACLAQSRRESKEESVLIVDLGAGTLDLSLLDVAGEVCQVVEIEGDNLLGSSDLDEILFAHFAEKLKKETEHVILEQTIACRRLRQACEELKIELSSHKEWTIKLPHLVESKTFELFMQREELERLAAPWLNRIRTTCRKIKHRPARLLLIGGGALMPVVRRCVQDVFGIEPSPGVDPLTAVARGAAIQAAILVGAAQKILLLDAVPFGLGIKSYSAEKTPTFKPLIRKHATIPTIASDTYSTREDNQNNVHIEVFQGEEPKTR